ncbi:MAG: M20/M25/M40 family metallo-hydrolase [Planctomycetaceae bacterium]|nr:M20/M25/M40 family metallo-hydrolase [Planctomycetaceae bacterium]
MRALLLGLILLWQADPSVEALKTIDEDTLKAHESVLASDEFEGRAAGFPGNEKAVAYLVKQVESFGLKPAGVDGYLQEFEFETQGTTRKAKNVIALLEGSDPALKEEFVLIGGHLDHVGRLGQAVSGQKDGAKGGDEIWNGADDNGSGTSAILTVARAFGKGAVRPRRSILFCWWNAEEAGLKGSAWWAGHPTRSIEKVTYCLNLDMVGRNPERPMDVEGVKNAEGDALERIITDACDAEKLKITKYDHTNEAMFRSDGVSLLRQGVPATMFFTYWHADYHAVGDHMDKIAYPNLAKIARSAFRIVRDAANLERGLRINPDVPLGGRPLGIRGEDVKLDGDAGGVKVAFVSAEGALGKAGVLENDTIVSFRGSALSAQRPMADLWKKAQASRGEGACAIEVMRGGEKKELTATWGR